MTQTTKEKPMLTNNLARTIFDISNFHINADDVYETGRMKEAYPHDRAVADINRNISMLASRGLVEDVTYNGYSSKAYRIKEEAITAYREWYRKGGFNVVEKWTE
jgi:hypothetical protein